jgi:hypothetical protein
MTTKLLRMYRTPTEALLDKHEGLSAESLLTGTGGAMTIALAMLAILVPASVTLVGYWFKQQADERLEQEQSNSEKERSQERAQEKDRLRLDAAMKAAALFEPSGSDAHDSAKAAAGLLALTNLGFADLAIALLVDLWSPHHSPADETSLTTERATTPFHVSKETAVQVIDSALQTSEPEAQLMAAELLCRKARMLCITESLDWPSSVNSAWIESLPDTAKLLIVDALVQMALASPPTENALRELTIRLYGISTGDHDKRVKGCIGTLMCSILTAVEAMGYDDFLMGPGHGHITLEQIRHAASLHSDNPDGYLEKIVMDRCERLQAWSTQCTELSLSTGALAPASCVVRQLAHAVT